MLRSFSRPVRVRAYYRIGVQNARPISKDHKKSFESFFDQHQQLQSNITNANASDGSETYAESNTTKDNSGAPALGSNGHAVSGELPKLNAVGATAGSEERKPSPGYRDQARAAKKIEYHGMSPRHDVEEEELKQEKTPLIAGVGTPRANDEKSVYNRFQGYLKDTLNQLSERRDEVTPTIDITRAEERRVTPLSALPTPRVIVEELDRHIQGQDAAKRAVAVAIRTRWRSAHIAATYGDSALPGSRNILMIGPVGTGKSEILRRVAEFCDLPVIKIMASQFLQPGRSNAAMVIEELVESAVERAYEAVKARALDTINQSIEDEILISVGLAGPDVSPKLKEDFLRQLRDGTFNNMEIQFDGNKANAAQSGSAIRLEGFNDLEQEEQSMRRRNLIRTLKHITAKKMDKYHQEGNMKPTIRVRDVLNVLSLVETDKIVSKEMVYEEAVRRVESEGIVYLQDIDKLCDKQQYANAEVAQLDLLALMEGSPVHTPTYGIVDTRNILVVAAGVFNMHDPSDLLPELQSRLPIRVQLKPFTESQYMQIVPMLLEQQKALFRTEGVELSFTDEAVAEIARIACDINASVANIGARRLHTIIERVVQDISFAAGDDKEGRLRRVVIDKQTVRANVNEMLMKTDLSRYVL